MIIEALPGLNDRDYLRTSGIGEAYFIPGVQTGSAMYPADSDDEEDNNVKAVEEGTYKPVTLLNKLGVLLSDSARKHPSSQENAVKTDKDLKLSALDFSRR